MHPTENDNRPQQDQQPTPSPNANLLRYAPIAVLLVVGFAVMMFLRQDQSGDEINFSDLRANYTQLATIEFKYQNDVIVGEFAAPVMLTTGDNGAPQAVTAFTTRGTEFQQSDLYTVINDYNILAESNATQPILVKTGSTPIELLVVIFNVLTFVLIIGFIIFMFRRAQGQVNGVFSFGQSRAKEYNADLSRVTFDDVAGQDSAKRELVEVVDFLKDPDKYLALGARIPRGVLMVGPPGTGKTLMARAVAGEANVAFYSISASEFMEMFVGVGASRVRDLFKKAKTNSPSIIFIDEVDAVGRQRGAGLGGGNDEREQTLNQMLSELDGFEQNSTVIVMAATNRPDVLDPALLRPGRFDRQVTVDLPDRKGRLAILKIHTRGKPLDPDVEIETMANATIGFSGADLANLANEAALHAARHNRKKITQPDFSNAFERIILGIERPPLSDPHERAVTAYHEAGHAVTALLTPGADQVLKVTITPRGFAGGVTAFIKDERRALKPKEYYESEIKVGLGGRVAEKVVFGEITAGAAGDIRQVTQIARHMVTQWGMSSLGMVDYSNGGNQPFLGYSLGQGRDYSEATAAKIDNEVRSLIDTAYDYTLDLLSKNRESLDTVANALLEREVLEREDLLDIMGMNPEKPIDKPSDAMDVDIDELFEEEVVSADDVADADDPFALFVDDHTEQDTSVPPKPSDDGNQPEQNQ